MSIFNSDDYIKLFKSLANEERLAIVKLLIKNKEMFAQDIERQFYLEQSTTSHHLNMLKKAGVTKSRKEGRKVFYSVNFDNLKDILDSFSKVLFN